MGIEHRPPLDYAGAASYLGTSTRHLRAMVAERRIPFIKLGKFVRFDPADLDDFLAARRVEAVAPRNGTAAAPRRARMQPARARVRRRRSA